MNFNFSKILIYVALAALGAFLAFWLRSEFMDERNALETEMHLHFVEDLIGLERSDVKKFLRRSDDKFKTKRRLTVYDSAADRRIMFFKDSFSDGLKDSIRLVIKNGTTVWQTQDPDLKIKKIDVGVNYFDSAKVEKFSTDSISRYDLEGFVETTKEQFDERMEGINLKAFKGIFPQTVFAFLLYSLLLSGFYLLQKNHRERQQLLENKNALIRNITHELQTPIATIAVALEAIQNYNIKEDKVKTNEYIATSRHQLKNLSDSIDRVMQMSKMDDRKEIFFFEKISIEALVNEAAADLKLQAAAKNAVIRIVAESEKLELTVDKYHFKNVLFNLLDNAIKYGKEGGKIEVSLEASDSDFFIEIKDDGVGITPENQEKIFERFYRISEGNRHNVKGYGLGLSYAKQVVEAHGGEISVESRVGAGSIFQIKIPKK